MLRGPARFRLVVPGIEALVVAAWVRALRPASPARLSWSRDIELASIGATFGLPVATTNLGDFTVIAALLGQVAPQLTLELRDFVGTG